jgi:hypothetical protein
LSLGCNRRLPAVVPGDLDRAAARYAELVAALVDRDPDSASGDTALPRPSGRSGHLSLLTIADQARTEATRLQSSAAAGRDPLRRDWLVDQLTAVAARASLQGGSRLSFDEELQQLFAVAGPEASRLELATARTQLRALLPRPGSAAQRLERFDARVTVPRDRLPDVFERALLECRNRTTTRLVLPAGESVDVQFVTGTPWSAFSSYTGNRHSRIDVNTAYPLTVDRVLELACHEGYPGHHVINMMRDRRAQDGRPELAAVPLFSPESFQSEAIATTAAALVFTDQERLAFERDVLFPLAGLQKTDAARHVAAARLLDRLAPAIGIALTTYLAGTQDFIETSWALQEQAFMQHPQATLLFANQFRGFALAYTWFKADAATQAGDLWRRYEAILRGEKRLSQST